MSGTSEYHNNLNIYAQILTQVQTAEVAKLLLLPLGPQSDTACKLKVSAGGKVRSHTFQSLQRAVEKVKSLKLNELEITYDPNQMQQSAFPRITKSVVGVLKPAVSSELWFISKNFSTEISRAIRNRRMNAKAREVALIHYKLDHSPSIIELAIEIESPKDEGFILSAFGPWLAENLPKALEPLSVFGCVDAGGDEYFVRLEAGVPMIDHIRIMVNVWPSAYPELGHRFDALHPILFGSKALGEDLSSALGKDARIMKSKTLREIAIVRFLSNCDLETAKIRAAPWLIANQKPEGL